MLIFPRAISCIIIPFSFFLLGRECPILNAEPHMDNHPSSYRDNSKCFPPLTIILLDVVTRDSLSICLSLYNKVGVHNPLRKIIYSTITSFHKVTIVITTTRCLIVRKRRIITNKGIHQLRIWCNVLCCNCKDTMTKLTTLNI